MKKVIVLVLTLCFLLLSACGENKSWTVTFDTDGGTIIESVTVKDGETVAEPEEPIKVLNDGVDYIFVAWTLDGVPFDFSTPIKEDITLKAKYKTSASSYVVFFDSDGGTVVESQQVEYGKTAIKPSNPEKHEQKVDYKFLFWSIGDQEFDFNTPITANITLKALYKKTEYCVVTFDTNGGNAISKVRVEKGKSMFKPQDPVKESDGTTEYRFVNWTLNGVPFDFNTAINSDITLKAEYVEYNSSLVMFDSDGGTPVQAKTVNNGEKVERPDDPIKASTPYIDYEFLYWTLNGVEFDFNTPITESITLIAKYAIYSSTVNK